MRPIAWCLMLTVACSPDQPLAGRCDDGTLCENAAWCVPGGGCPPPTDCTYAEDGANCNYGSDPGRCTDGRCEEIPSACDGAAIDPGEACDGEAVSCTTLDGYHGGTAACRNCTLDVERCYRIGWQRRATVPAIGLSVWADNGVPWLGTSDGLYAYVRGAFERVEPGSWPHVAGIRGGDVLALNTTGELLRLPRTPDAVATRTQIVATPRSLTVIGDEIFIGAKQSIHRASTGFIAEPALGGDVYAIHQIDGALYAAGGSAGVGLLWHSIDGVWTPVVLDSVPTITSLSSTGSVLELGTPDGWYRLVDGVATYDGTRVGNRAVRWSGGRFLFDRYAVGPTQYIDASARVAPIESPAPVALTAASWDPDRRALWALDRGGVLYTHSGIELGRLDSPGVIDVQRLGNDLSVAFDGMGTSTPHVTVMPGDGLTASLPLSPPLIATVTAGVAGAIVGLFSDDHDHHFVAGFLGTSSTILVYDTTTGSYLPKSWVGPGNMRAFARHGSDVLAVGLGGAARYTGLNGVQTWLPASDGMPEGVDLRAIATTTDGFVTVGAGGAMFALSPPTWRWVPMYSGTSADLTAVHVIGDEIFAAGAGGTLLRCGAEACTRMETGTTADLADVDGQRTDDLFAVGGGAMLHFDGVEWKSIAIPGFMPSRVAVGETTVWLGERETTSRGLYQLLRISPL